MVARIRRLALGVVGLTIALVACQEVTGPIWVDSLSLDPDSIFIVPGETAQFTSVPRDQRDNPLPERSERTEWSIANASVASIESVGGVATVTALRPGATFVRVSLGRGSGSGPVYVEPQDLREIRIEPSELILDRTGGGFGSRTVVRPILIGLDGQEVSTDGYRISWRTSDTRVFIMVGLQEVVTGTSISVGARNPGQATLSLQVGDRRLSVPVVVR